jgi:hypothetical protein
MKIPHLLFILIGLGALTRGLDAAGELSKPPAEQEARDQHGGSVHAAGPGHGGVETDRPRSLLNSSSRVPQKSSQTGPLHIPPKSAPARELHAPASAKTAAAAKEGLMVSRTISYHQPPPKLPVGSGKAPAPAEAVHDQRRAAPAATSKKSAAALDGAAVKGKTW